MLDIQIIKTREQMENDVAKLWGFEEEIIVDFFKMCEDETINDIKIQERYEQILSEYEDWEEEEREQDEIVLIEQMKYEIYKRFGDKSEEWDKFIEECENEDIAEIEKMCETLLEERTK